jgi:uncharacterized protein (DUF58 family)
MSDEPHIADSVAPPGLTDEGPASLIMVPLLQLLAVLSFFLALLFFHRGLALFSLLIVALPLLAKMWAGYGRSGVRYFAGADTLRLFPGEVLTHALVVENRCWLPLGLELGRPETTAFEPLAADGNGSYRCRLLGYQRMRLQWAFKAKRRGVYQLSAPGMSVGDLFGFCMRPVADTAASMEVVVYPRIRPIAMSGFSGSWFFGRLTCGGLVQDPAYFLGTREYQFRQSTRFIHWKASARHQRLQEKIFEPSRQEKMLLVVETGHFQGDRRNLFESMLETVASLAVKLDGLGHAVGLLANAGWAGQACLNVPASRRPGQLSQVLEALARLEPRPVMQMTELLTQAMRLSWEISVLYFSSGTDDELRHAEAYFAMKKIPAVLVAAEHSGGYRAGTVWMDDLYLKPDTGPGPQAEGDVSAEESVA